MTTRNNQSPLTVACRFIYLLKESEVEDLLDVTLRFPSFLSTFYHYCLTIAYILAYMTGTPSRLLLPIGGE